MNTSIKDFTQLTAWQIAKELSLVIYKATEKFPSSELFGLTSQLRRASISVSSNIAEGFGRTSKKEKVQFYNIAVGSVVEIQSQAIIASELGLLSLDDREKIMKLALDVKKTTSGLMRSIRES